MINDDTCWIVFVFFDKGIVQKSLELLRIEIIRSNRDTHQPTGIMADVKSTRIKHLLSTRMEGNPCKQHIRMFFGNRPNLWMLWQLW